MSNETKKNIKRYIPPTIIGVILVAFFIVMDIGFSFIPNLEVWQKTLLLLVPTICCIIAIGATIQRIKEIKGGEEDDSRKY